MPYDEGGPGIGDVELTQILEAARWAPTAHNMQNFEIVAVDDRAVLDAIGRIRTAVSDTFLRENYAQLAFSEKELQNRGTGVLADMFPPAWRQPEPKADDVVDFAHAFLGGSIRHAPCCSSSSTIRPGARRRRKATCWDSCRWAASCRTCG